MPGRPAARRCSRRRPVEKSSTHDDLVTATQELADDVAPDEAGAAGDEDLHPSVGPAGRGAGDAPDADVGEPLGLRRCAGQQVPAVEHDSAGHGRPDLARAGPVENSGQSDRMARASAPVAAAMRRRPEQVPDHVVGARRILDDPRVVGLDAGALVQHEMDDVGGRGVARVLGIALEGQAPDARSSVPRASRGASAVGGPHSGAGCR